MSRHFIKKLIEAIKMNFIIQLDSIKKWATHFAGGLSYFSVIFPSIIKMVLYFDFALKTSTSSTPNYMIIFNQSDSFGDRKCSLKFHEWSGIQWYLVEGV